MACRRRDLPCLALSYTHDAARHSYEKGKNLDLLVPPPSGCLV